MNFKDLTTQEWQEIATRMLAAKIYYEDLGRRDHTGVQIHDQCSWESSKNKYKYISAAQQALQISVPKLVVIPENVSPDLFDFVISVVQVCPGSKEQPERARKAIETLREISRQLE